MCPISPKNALKLHNDKQRLTSEEAILSAKNSENLQPDRAPSVPNLARELTVLLRRSSWWERLNVSSPKISPPLLAFGLQAEAEDGEFHKLFSQLKFSSTISLKVSRKFR